MDRNEIKANRENLGRLIRAGAWISIACASDACTACKAQAGKIYRPDQVPRLPLPGCQRTECRCQYVAVDPETELTVSQLIERGAYALRAGRIDAAQQMLRRAVALDENIESGWLWLSGAVDDQEKVVCLEKVLLINPRNEHARAGLIKLRQKLSQPAPSPASPPTAPEASARPSLVTPPAVSEARPSLATVSPPPVSRAKPQPAAVAQPQATLTQVREERQVIIEQWQEFMQIATATDPELIHMQGNAFLKKVERLNTQALNVAPPLMKLEELELQWHELESIGQVLTEMIHDQENKKLPNWAEMNQNIRKIIQMLLKHRHNLRLKIREAGGQVPD